MMSGRSSIWAGFCGYCGNSTHQRVRTLVPRTQSRHEEEHSGFRILGGRKIGGRPPGGQVSEGCRSVLAHAELTRPNKRSSSVGLGVSTAVFLASQVASWAIAQYACFLDLLGDARGVPGGTGFGRVSSSYCACRVDSPGQTWLVSRSRGAYALARCPQHPRWRRWRPSRMPYF